MRADPPGAAAGDAPIALEGRRAVFSAALEQSEQLFAAAAAADHGIRPMLLFYGLSQAGRAIAAAANSLEDGWRPSAHGLTCGGSAVRGAQHLADLRVWASGNQPRPGRRPTRDQEDGAGAFGILCDVLESPNWQDSSTESVSLGALFAAHPELPDFPNREEWPAIQAAPYPASELIGTHTNVASLTILRPPAWMLDRRDEIPDRYLEFAGLSMRLVPLDAPNPADPQTELLGVYPDDKQPTRALTDWLRPPGLPRPWLTPRLAGTTGRQHPLVLWWAVLFALSIRARYDPQGWTRDLDPDTTNYAVVLQELLDIATVECPQHIFGLFAKSLEITFLWSNV